MSKALDEVSMKAIEAKNCPICGHPPDISTAGSCINIDCCVSMSREKTDYMTIEERENTQMENFHYAPEIEARILAAVVAEWNIRK